MSLLLEEIKPFIKYDKISLKKEIPLFRIPIHTVIKGQKIISNFNFDLFRERNIVSFKTETTKQTEANFIFLKNFGTCKVLHGLRSSETEFNILCGIDSYNNSIVWVYLSNQEFAELLLNNQKNKTINSKDDFEKFKVGKVYIYSENAQRALPINIYKNQSVNFNSYGKDDPHKHYSLLGTDVCSSLNAGDSFLVLKTISTFDNIDDLEQKDIKFEKKYQIIAEYMLYVIGVGKEFLGYINPKIYTSSVYFDEK